MQPGKEWTVVLNLMRRKCLTSFQKKAAGIAEDVGNGVAAIFSVPKSPGRVYFDAKAFGPVLELSHRIDHIYTALAFTVPLAERIALLRPSNVSPPLEEGNHVKIRNGLYKDDVGEVVRIEDDTSDIVVKLQSRQWQRHETQTRKRKRRPGRPSPWVLDKKSLMETYGGERITNDCGSEEAHRGPTDSPFKDLGRRGFLFQGHQYTNDGHILLRFRNDRLERILQHPDSDADCAMTTANPSHFDSIHFDRTINTEYDPQSLLDNVLAIHTPKFIKAGDAVRVVRGAQAGVSGRVIDMRDTSTSQVCVVDVGKRVGDVRRSVFLEATVECLEREFEYGEVVEVKFGTFKGRTGTVAFCDDQRVAIVCTRDFVEVRDHFVFW